jgi:hypothetical protein
MVGESLQMPSTIIYALLNIMLKIVDKALSLCSVMSFLTRGFPLGLVTGQN